MSDTVYKLTYPNDRTLGHMQWGPGITHTAPGGGELCTEAFIHAYSSPLLAVFLDRIHARFGPNAHLWCCEASGEHKTDYGLKEGYTILTTIERIPRPVVTLIQHIKFGILCARAVETKRAWCKWATDWLANTDRSIGAAWAACERAQTDAAKWASQAAQARLQEDVQYCVARAAQAAMHHTPKGKTIHLRELACLAIGGL